MKKFHSKIQTQDQFGVWLYKSGSIYIYKRKPQRNQKIIFTVHFSRTERLGWERKARTKHPFTWQLLFLVFFVSGNFLAFPKAEKNPVHSVSEFVQSGLGKVRYFPDTKRERERKQKLPCKRAFKTHPGKVPGLYIYILIPRYEEYSGIFPLRNA